MNLTAVARTQRPRYIFLHFLNPEIRALYEVDGAWSPAELHREWMRLSKYAFLVADQGLAIPASYMFEVPEISSVLDDLQPVQRQGLLHVASPTADLLLFAQQKQREYRDEAVLFDRYSSDDRVDANHHGLNWLPRVDRSASGDIATAWRGELERADGLWQHLLESKTARQLTLPSVLETAIEAVPGRLDGRAFIYRFVEPLLPFKPEPVGESQLKLLISREYLRSYLLELGAAVLIDTPIGNLGCGIERISSAGDVQTVSWRTIADSFEALGIRHQIETLGWRDLSRLRVQPVLHWLLELILTPSKERRNLFEDIVTLSRFQAPKLPSRSARRRTYDIVLDQVWRFQMAAASVLHSRESPGVSDSDHSGRPLLYRRRRRQMTLTSQPSILPDSCDVGLVVALPEEFRELQRQLATRWRPIYDNESGTDYYLFEGPAPEGYAAYDCVTTFAGSMGPTKAALLTERLRTRWGVRVIVNVGIAGALDDDVRIGDVVAASVADNYLERSKAVDASGTDGFEFRLAGESFRPTRVLVDACAHFEFAHSTLFARWLELCQVFLAGAVQPEQLAALRAANLLAEHPASIQGHVACGPAVGASLGFKRWLKGRDRSYLTLDMESGGVLWAVYDAARAVDGLVLRGVSDYADERKAELDRIGRGDLRRYAMHNALQFFWALMAAGRLPRAELS
jgi:nucleoside phosphorylase